MTGRLLEKQTRSFPNREITCRHFAYSREKSNFVSAFGYPPPTLDSPSLSIKVCYYALTNISCCEIRGPNGADKKLYDLPVISLTIRAATENLGGNEKYTSCTNRHVSVLQQSHKMRIKAIILKQNNISFSSSLIMRCTEAQLPPSPPQWV